MDKRSEILNLAESFFREKEKPPFIPGETYLPPSGKVVDEHDLRALVDASLDMWLTTGRYGAQFEKELPKKLGLRYSRVTVSGSAANLLAFSALTSPKLPHPIRPGSEVITVAAGFPTTVAPIVQNGCVPVFVDVDLGSYNLKTQDLEKALSPKTRAIMVAHTLGNPFDIDKISAFAKSHGLYLIEDCCDALGASFDNKPVGSFGDLATLSFYPAHQMTMGEGGAVLTSNAELMRLVESFRDWGRDCWCKPGHDNTCGKRFEWKLGDLPEGYDHKYIYSHLGYNLKVTDMQAALGCSQLAKVDGFVEARRNNFAHLYEGLMRLGMEEHFILPHHSPQSRPSWFGFCLTRRDESPLTRRQIINYLEENKVGTRLLFGGDMTKQPAFLSTPFRKVGDLPSTDKVMRDSFWIGVWPGLQSAQLNYMLEVFEGLKKLVH